MTAMRTRLVVVLATAALALPLAACSAGTSSISASSLEKQLADALEKDVGQRPDAIDCPKDLEGEVGAEVRCTLTAGADELGVEVTVTDVDGSDIEFDYAVDEASS
jgi:hypothetical protein